MRVPGVALLAVWIVLLTAASTGAGPASAAARGGEAVKVTTDGQLRVGHRETIRVSGFRGKGIVQVAFFPTAICEDGCGARSIVAGRTGANGAGTFRVRVPGTFFNVRERPTYFRNGERVEVEVSWEGADHSFGHGSARPEPVIVRVPDGFRLKASNGYTLYAVAEPPRQGTAGTLLLIASAKGRQVTYDAPATLTETSIEANLGEVGQISIEFQRSGQGTAIPCGKRKVRFASGSWVGTIQFHGEEGYADAEATSVPGNVEFILGDLCGSLVTGGPSGPRKGAELFVRNPGLGPQLSVYKHRPGAAALITARLREYISGISIERVAAAWMPGHDFSYDRRLRTAAVTPPAPFAGSARFDLGVKAGRRWSGDLTVDLPGRSDVPLTSPLLRASLSPSE